MTGRKNYDQYELGVMMGDTGRVMVRLKGADQCAAEMRALRNALRALADALPPRTSLRQALSFVAVTDAWMRGRAVTMKDLRLYLGEDEDDARRVGQSVANTFSVFLDLPAPSLGWIEQVNDIDDRRKKYLQPTTEGETVLYDLTERMKAAIEDGVPSLQTEDGQ